MIRKVNQFPLQISLRHSEAQDSESLRGPELGAYLWSLSSLSLERGSLSDFVPRFWSATDALPESMLIRGEGE